MGPNLEKAIFEISLRMRLLKAMQEEVGSSGNLTERDVMILELLNAQSRMTVSQIRKVQCVRFPWELYGILMFSLLIVWDWYRNHFLK